MNLREKIEGLLALGEKATPGPWEFRSGNDANGESCDLLMAEIGQANGDEDPEYAEVLFGSELGDAQLAANWELVHALRNAVPALLRLTLALLELRQRISDCHKDPRYQAVWQIYAIHGGLYTEPKYEKEWLAAKAALSEAEAALGVQR
jgi:hypothetical protein